MQKVCFLLFWYVIRFSEGPIDACPAWCLIRLFEIPITLQAGQASIGPSGNLIRHQAGHTSNQNTNTTNHTHPTTRVCVGGGGGGVVVQLLLFLFLLLSFVVLEAACLLSSTTCNLPLFCDTGPCSFLDSRPFFVPHYTSNLLSSKELSSHKRPHGCVCDAGPIGACPAWCLIRLAYCLIDACPAWCLNRFPEGPNGAGTVRYLIKATKSVIRVTPLTLINPNEALIEHL